MKSLWEMLALIIIVALLGAKCIDMYLDHHNKSKVITALAALNNLDRLAVAEFHNEVSATKIDDLLETMPLAQALYIKAAGSKHVPHNSHLICIYIDGLYYSGYVAPTFRNAGSGSRLCMQTYYKNNSITKKCGQLDGSAADLNLKYLPANCDCAGIWSGGC